MRTSPEKGLAAVLRGGAHAALAHLNQLIQGTKFALIFREINPQQASCIGQNCHIPKSSRKRPWCNCPKNGASCWSCASRTSSSAKHILMQSLERDYCIILLLQNQKGSRTAAAKLWKSFAPSSWRTHICYIHNVRLRGRFEIETRLKKYAKHLQSGFLDVEG